MNNPLEHLYRGDGWRCRIGNTLTRKVVYLELVEDGLVTRCEELWSATDPGDFVVGDDIRAYMLGAALCRYWFTGGDISYASLVDVFGTFIDVVGKGRVVVEGHDYFDSVINTEGSYEHVFTRKENKEHCLVVVEGEFVEEAHTRDVIDRWDASGIETAELRRVEGDNQEPKDGET